MKQLGLIFLLVLSIFLFFGCVAQEPSCGDNVCNGKETFATCQGDCPAPANDNGYLQVNVFDANTGLPVEGAVITTSESASDSCKLDVLSTPLNISNTDENGFVSVNLEAGKTYIAALMSDIYYLPDYKCVTITNGKTSVVNYYLNLVPAFAFTE